MRYRYSPMARMLEKWFGTLPIRLLWHRGTLSSYVVRVSLDSVPLASVASLDAGALSARDLG